ncbi:amidohydrolase family protein [Amycolatopsis minnesotensis]|uniref:Amidohydrolase family protein n=1 Tax=Amycolatopsis minnesotensis TaxID=337894 RepID=A0ABN2QSR9_9PSEU
MSPVVRIENATVFDGERVLGTVTVDIAGGLLLPPGHGAEPSTVVDGTGRTLLPGFVDAHTHVCHAGENLALALSFGVTTELDMFDFPPETVAELWASADRDGRADLRSAGTLASAAGGTTVRSIPWIPTLSGPAEAEAFVAARHAEGSDYLKIALDDGAEHGLALPSLDLATVTALVAAARRRAMVSVAHLSGPWSVALALDAGVDVLTHLPLTEVVPPAQARRAAAAGVTAVPTLAVLEMRAGDEGRVLADDPLVGPRLPGEVRAAIETGTDGLPVVRRGTFATALASAGELHRAGVPLLAGTDAHQAPGRDAPVVHGATLHRELELLVRAGLSTAEALTAATSAPARRFGLPDRGRIAPGLRADLVLVDGDPIADIRATRAIAAVWRRGELLTPRFITGGNR